MTGIGAIQSSSGYNFSFNSLAKNLQRLSTGKRLITDDPAGMGISSRLSSQLSATEMAGRNISSAISMTKTSSSWMSQVSDSLNRMKSLAIKANSGILSASDQRNIQSEFQALQEGVVSITSSNSAMAQFNGTYLLRGGNGQAGEGDVVEGGDLSLQSGPDLGQETDLEMPNLDVTNNQEIGSFNTYEYNDQNEVVNTETVDVAWDEIINSADGIRVDDPDVIGKLDEAINYVAEAAASVAADQVILEDQYEGLMQYADNLQSSATKIRDVDMAYEAMSFASNQVKNNAALAMQIQGSQISSQSLLFLLQKNN